MKENFYSSDIFKNPFKFLDAEDILDDPVRAVVFFQDLLVKRPTEFTALINLYMKALHSIDMSRVALTNRQDEAVRYAREGAKKGLNPTKYAAAKLNVSERAVQRIMKRASDRLELKMFAFDMKVPTTDSKRINWYPTKAQIKAQIAKMQRDCAGCGLEIKSGRFTLCRECGERFGFSREEWATSKKGEPAPERWLLPEARRIDRQIRKDAINELFRARGFVDEDVEEMLERYHYQNAS